MMQDSVGTTDPYYTGVFSKRLPIYYVSLLADLFQMPRFQTLKGVGDILMHAELEFHTVTVVYLHSGEPYDRRFWCPNRCLFSLGFMVQSQVWSPNKLQSKNNYISN